MKKARIFTLKGGSDLSITLDGKSIYKPEIEKIDLSGLETVSADKNEINIVILNISADEFAKSRQIIQKAFDNFIFSLILIVTDNSAVLRSSLNDSRYFVMDNPLHMEEMNHILDKAILASYYRMTAFEIGESCLGNIGFFEGIFDLAKKEKLDIDAENTALKNLLNYETELKKFQDNLNSAFEKLLKIKDSEILEMKKRLDASEKLDKLREKEIRDALDSAEAIEKVLQYTRVEEMNMDKTIKAQTQLFEYTTQQVQELIEENKKLKAMLKKD